MDFSFTRTNVNPYSEAIYVGDAHGSARRWLLRIGARTPAGKVPCRDGDTQTEGDAYEEATLGRSRRVVPFGAVCRDDAPACAEGVRRRRQLGAEQKRRCRQPRGRFG